MDLQGPKDPQTSTELDISDINDAPAEEQRRPGIGLWKAWTDGDLSRSKRREVVADEAVSFRFPVPT